MANATSKTDSNSEIPPVKIKKPSPKPQILKVVLEENDLEEKFVKGSGPGGQKINKRAHCVQLLHKPTNTFVECQRFRELFANRQEARKLMKRKLDVLYNGENSREAKLVKKEQKRKQKAKSRAKNKFKERDEALRNTAVGAGDSAFDTVNDEDDEAEDEDFDDDDDDVDEDDDSCIEDEKKSTNATN